jgi:hypothetical protein
MTENPTNQYWTLRIRPHEKLWQIHLGEIWRYRDLIGLFVRRNIMGRVWKHGRRLFFMELLKKNGIREYEMYIDYSSPVYEERFRPLAVK